MSFYLKHFQPFFFPHSSSPLPCIHPSQDIILPPARPQSLSLSLSATLALPPLVTLLELSKSASPQVLPRDEQASLVRHHAALPGGIVICTQEQVLLARLDLWTFAGHVFGTHPQELVPTADAVLTLFVDRDYVDSKLPPLACLVSFQDVHLYSWCKKKRRNKGETSTISYYSYHRDQLSLPSQLVMGSMAY